MNKSKRKEIMKVAAISVLSTGLFSAAFVSVNSLVISAATNGTEPLALMEAAVNIPQNIPQGEFVQPNLNLIETDWEQYATKPSYAMSMEEAAQIGAQYIWDVFGESIDDMYVSMSFVAWQGHSRVQWAGTVAPTAEALELEPDLYEPMYSFLIDAVTGERVDIGYYGTSTRNTISREQREELNEWYRNPESYKQVEAWEETIFEIITPEQLEAYSQQAEEIAQLHFNNSTVVDVQLGNEWSIGPNCIPLHDENGNIILVLDGIDFTVTDDTGRTADVRIPTESGFSPSIRIVTQHNDRIPGYNYDRPGLG